jgi:hypothetical protein
MSVVARVARALSRGALGLLLLVGCQDLTGSQQLPSGTQNPAYYSTPAGALGMRTAAIYTLEQALPRFLIDAGLLTDELEDPQTGASPGARLGASLPTGGSLDARILPELTYGASGTSADQDYDALQKIRGAANQALGALAAYDTGANRQGDPGVMRGELYALEAYDEILLADLFCSGVPLSTLDFQKDFTYHASSTTDQIYQDAIHKADSALALADTSQQVLNLARVVQGRAWLDRGNYAAAADDVESVPEGFTYELTFNVYNGLSNYINNNVFRDGEISDSEGGTGLPFISSGDPRTRDTVFCVGCLNAANEGLNVDGYIPIKYSAGLSDAGYAPFTVADWVEARLIQAEAAWHSIPTGQGSWLDQLNALRATAPIPGTTQPQPNALPPLTDPGATLTGSAADSARVSLLFQERAYWLYLTGHRQGDLRRLIRQYRRQQNTVYPTGPYLAPGAETYGMDINAPIASSEYSNPLFHGCLNRGA